MERIKNTMEKIADVVIAIMTIISPILFIAGVFGVDTPDTAIPEIMIMIALAWFGFILYCCKSEN
jgi:arginine exporter protein ArgO